MVLCCLEGLSYDLAARRLGVSEPTLRGRLHRARKRLAARLRGRGILAPPVARLTEPAGLSVPPLPASLVESTVQLASRWSSVSGLLVGASAVPESIAALARGVIHAMILQTVKSTGVAVLLAAGVLGTVVVAQQGKNPGADAAAPPADASLLLAQNKPPAVPEAQKTPTPQELERKNRQIQQRLDQMIELDPANVFQLDQLLKHIKQATTDAQFPGIPIYVSPFGLQEAGVGFHSDISVGKGKQTVRTILWWGLHPLKLSYIVKDGFLMIDSRSAITEIRVEEVERKLDRVLETLERLERAK